jgi:hypothetical protein
MRSLAFCLIGDAPEDIRIHCRFSAHAAVETQFSLFQTLCVICPRLKKNQSFVKVIEFDSQRSSVWQAITMSDSGERSEIEIDNENLSNLGHPLIPLVIGFVLPVKSCDGRELRTMQLPGRPPSRTLPGLRSVFALRTAVGG